MTEPKGYGPSGPRATGRALAHPDRSAAPVLLNTCYWRTRPVRIIFGEADPCLNAGVARDFHEKFPTREPFLVPFARQFPQLDEPEEVARLNLSRPPADGVGPVIGPHGVSRGNFVNES